MSGLRRSIRVLLRAAMRGRHRLLVEGELPDQAVLLVANHSSHLDTAAVLAAVGGSPSRLRVAAAADYFFRNRLAGAAAGGLLGAFPFPRDRGCRTGLRRCSTLVAAGESVLIFPEGTRAAAGARCNFKPGVGLLARGGTSVVPVGIAGTAEALPRGSRRLGRGRVVVVIGRPMAFGDDVDARRAASEMESAVNALVIRAEALRGGQFPSQAPSAQALRAAVSWPASTSVPPISPSARRMRSIPR